MSRRRLKYFAFGDVGCRNMQSFTHIARKHKLTVGMLWRYLISYSNFRRNASRHHPRNVASAFEFIVKRLGSAEALVAHPQLADKKANDGQASSSEQGSADAKEEKEQAQSLSRQMSFDEDGLDLTDNEHESADDCNTSAHKQSDKKPADKDQSVADESDDDVDMDLV